MCDQQQHGHEKTDTIRAGAAPETACKYIIGCSLAFDDAAQVNLEITAAAQDRVASAIKAVQTGDGKQQELRSIARFPHRQCSLARQNALPFLRSARPLESREMQLYWRRKIMLRRTRLSESAI